MALFKEFKKKSLSDPRETFESMVINKLDTLECCINENNSMSKIAQNEQIDFLLNVAPFIKEYYSEDSMPNEDEDDVKKSMDMSKVNMQNYVITQQSTNRKGVVYENYMRHIGMSSELSKDCYNVENYCTKCNVAKIYDTVDSSLICPTCGDYKHIMLPNVCNNTVINQTNNDHIETTPYYCYKRSNHFSEWLSQLQGKETTYIPETVYVSLLKELKKERITETKDITHAKIRLYLKKLKLNKYYEHIPHIIRKLKNEQPPKIKPDIEETLRQMFFLIQEPFKKHCPSNRKNFLSYSYTLYKMSEILGEDEMLEQFTLPLLKSRDKLSVQDKIWKGICKELDWEFIPTI